MGTAEDYRFSSFSYSVGYKTKDTVASFQGVGKTGGAIMYKNHKPQQARGFAPQDAHVASAGRAETQAMLRAVAIILARHEMRSLKRLYTDFDRGGNRSAARDRASQDRSSG